MIYIGFQVFRFVCTTCTSDFEWELGLTCLKGSAQGMCMVSASGCETVYNPTVSFLQILIPAPLNSGAPRYQFLQNFISLTVSQHFNSRLPEDVFCSLTSRKTTPESTVASPKPRLDLFRPAPCSTSDPENASENTWGTDEGVA